MNLLIQIFFEILMLNNFSRESHIPFKAFHNFFVQRAPYLFVLLISSEIEYQSLVLSLLSFLAIHLLIFKDFQSSTLSLLTSLQD